MFYTPKNNENGTFRGIVITSIENRLKSSNDSNLKIEQDIKITDTRSTKIVLDLDSGKNIHMFFYPDSKAENMTVTNGKISCHWRFNMDAFAAARENAALITPRNISSYLIKNGILDQHYNLCRNIVVIFENEDKGQSIALRSIPSGLFSGPYGDCALPESPLIYGKYYALSVPITLVLAGVGALVRFLRNRQIYSADDDELGDEQIYRLNDDESSV